MQGLCSSKTCAILTVILATLLPPLLSHLFDGKMRLYYPKPRFSLEDMPDLTGKVAIVTGSNTGIGKETARELSRKGAHVIVASRSKSKGLAAVKEIEQETRGHVEFVSLDLASFSSIRQFAKDISTRGLPVHLLVNNAGVMACPFGLTEEGIEMQFGVNHVGHHLLTKLLLPLLENSAPSRIVTVSSAASFLPEYLEGQAFNLTDVFANYEERYVPLAAYGRSKLANVLFTRELNKRLAGKKVFANALHPGGIATELPRYVLPKEGDHSVRARLSRFLSTTFLSVFLQPPEGALTSLYLATSPEVEAQNIRGKYFHPIAIETKMPAFAEREELQNDLWRFTEELIAKYPLTPILSENL